MACKNELDTNSLYIHYIVGSYRNEQIEICKSNDCYKFTSSNEAFEYISRQLTDLYRKVSDYKFLINITAFRIGFHFLVQCMVKRK